MHGAVVGIVLAALFAGCGARSGLPEAGSSAVVSADGGSADGGSDTATGSCSPLCADNTRGTWRIEDASHDVIGYFFTFDGTVTCNGSTDSYLLVLGAAGDQQCSRNGDYEIQTNDDTAFFISADNLGGNASTTCGGDPNGELMTVQLTRAPCDPQTYELIAQDSATDSPYTFSAVATRCRCDIGWEPCAAPQPDDPCAP
jgi:hypothetical protein